MLRKVFQTLPVLWLWLFVSELQAQDIRFSQFYQAPIYLNPAFTGTTDVGRAGLNYRIQGTNTQSNFTTLSGYVDYNFVDHSVSAGFLVLDDKDEVSGYRSTTVALPISYEFQINDWLVLKPALQPSYTSQRIDFSGILFADQLDNQGNIIGNTREAIAGMAVNYFDVAFGTMAYGEKYWFGVSAHNLLENNVSFFEGGRETLQRRVSLHGGYNIDVRPYWMRNRQQRIIMPSFSVVMQGEFTQVDAGLYAFMEPIIGGIFYRNLPTGDNDNAAISVMAGVRLLGFTFGYSYDHYLDTFNTSPGGAHEFSLTYLFDLSDPNKPPRSSRLLRCPLPLNL